MSDKPQYIAGKPERKIVMTFEDELDAIQSLRAQCSDLSARLEDATDEINRLRDILKDIVELYDRETGIPDDILDKAWAILKEDPLYSHPKEPGQS